MARPEDVSGALRAVWEVRRGEERLQHRIGAWQNIIFGLMAATIFASYGAAGALGLEGPLLHVLWLPPLLAAYAAVAFATKNVLQLPRPTLPWREMAIGTGLFVGLMGVLALAVVNGVLGDVAAGMSIVIGSFYVILGLVFIREPVPALFGVGLAAGAVALALLDLGYAASTLYGIFVAGGGMVAMGLWMLRHPEGGGPPARQGGEGERPPELQQVRETLASLRGHEAALGARERAARTFLAAAVLALGGVAGFLGGAHPHPWVLLLFAGVVAAFGVVRQRAAAREEARHGA